jgi:RND family efflux transporter MFP subunit
MKKKMIISGKVRWLILGVLILAIAGGGGYYYYSTTRSKRTVIATVAPVQTATAFRGNIVLQASGTGTLTPANQSSFGFGTSGQIIAMDVKIGDHVEAGQVLGKLDDTAAQAALDQAKRNLADLSTPAAIAQAQQAVAQAEVDITNAHTSLQRLISPDVMYWEGQVATAEETLKAAQTDGGTSPTTAQQAKIDQANAALKRAQDNLQAAKLAYINIYVPATFSYQVTHQETINLRVTDVTTTEIVPPSDAEIAAARATYQLALEKQKEAQAYLDLLNGKALPQDVPGSSLTSLVAAQTALQTAQDNLNATQLISPITGTVIDVTANVGDNVSNSSIITVADISQPYTIDAYFDTEDWLNVKAGYVANITFDALPGQSFKGKVTVVYPTLDTSSNSSLVHVTVKLTETIDSSLPIGATAAVDVISGQANNAVLIPIEALHQTDPGKYAVFVKANGKLRLRQIDVGLQDAAYAEVKSGLQVGDVVTTGITAVQQ